MEAYYLFSKLLSIFYLRKTPFLWKFHRVAIYTVQKTKWAYDDINRKGIKDHRVGLLFLRGVGADRILNRLYLRCVYLIHLTSATSMPKFFGVVFLLLMSLFINFFTACMAVPFSCYYKWSTIWIPFSRSNPISQTWTILTSYLSLKNNSSSGMRFKLCRLICSLLILWTTLR